MRKRRLKNWVRVILYGIATGIVMLSLIIINSNLEKDFMKDCENSGYSTNFCIAHK